MGRKLKYDMPGPDWRRSVDEIRELGWPALFAPDLEPPLELIVEIGFGRGEFIVDLAGQHPTAAHVGIEVSFKRVLKLARRIAASPLRNLRLVNARGEEVLRDGLEPDSVAVCWVNFPDPWPKKRHAKHRLIQPAFVERLTTRLVSGGLLRVATDSRAYAEQIDEVLAAEPQLENAYAPVHWLPEVQGRRHTGYEDEWRAQGRPLHFFEYRRIGSSGR